MRQSTIHKALGCLVHGTEKTYGFSRTRHKEPTVLCAKKPFGFLLNQWFLVIKDFHCNVMRMDRQTILKVAEIARLRLTEEELARFEKEFDRIFDYFSVLNKLQLQKEFGYATDNKNVFREDKINSNNSEEILKSVPKTDKRYLKVPKGFQ